MKPTWECQQCGVEFQRYSQDAAQPPTFCSRQCNGLAQRLPVTPRERPVVTITCERCGKTVQRIQQSYQQRFCTRQCSAIGIHDGRTSHPLYYVWTAMRARCRNPQHPYWVNYGGRGIQVCAEWDRDFWQFASGVGPRPDDGQRWSLDRINNAGNYEPGNVRWATQTTQMNNTRNSRVVHHLVFIREQLAQGRNPTELSRELGLGKSSVLGYIRRHPELFPEFVDRPLQRSVREHLDYIRDRLAAGARPVTISRELELEKCSVAQFIRANPDLFPDH